MYKHIFSYAFIYTAHEILHVQTYRANRIAYLDLYVHKHVCLDVYTYTIAHQDLYMYKHTFLDVYTYRAHQILYV